MTGCCSAERRCTLRYGKGEVELDLSQAASVSWLYGNEMPSISDLSEAFRRAVEEDCEGAPLRARLSTGDKITIILSDITRFWMRQDKICELLVKYLEAVCGVADKNIAVLIALGTHRPMTEKELETLASPYVYARCQVLNHDCDASNLVDVGITRYGNRVEVNPLVVGRKVIVVSGTVHHLMAGYGGGRKSILPGICSRATIRRNHCMALDPQEARSSEHVGSGKLTDNPIHEDMDDAAALVAPAFGVSIVVNAGAGHSGIFCGDFQTAWMRSCAFCQKYYGKEIAKETDVVIASCGGFPKDLNLYQGVKSLLNGVNALKRGGTFVFLCECPEGGGAPDFFDWTKPLSQGRLDPALREAFTIAGYIFYASCESIRKAGRFMMLSKIDPALVRDMGIESFQNVEDIQKNLQLAGKSVTVIPYGGYVLPQNSATYAKLNGEF
ncbi:MAG TPA: nickel-dependent lactate racemase [Candidatus Pullichristensenella stercorigallinarum]|uniref:Nickel-dependent lactate racemase n=1 Tax=Candidatus Pullichristensenella stercorigallinarum TaxID=2840909 RepID=A0A9D0ZK34_9FIRM|nr:nickel-dependent lactate racemase [Candidatus Pullichristensenella stercorigallinarum]